MTDSAQLVPSQRHPHLTLAEIPASDGARVGSLYREIWEPLGGGGRSRWTDAQWVDELNQPGIGAWVARIDGSDAGMAELEWSATGDAAIVIIGVVPSLQGQGVGGDLLTRLSHMMWHTPGPSGRATQRVWLWTVPDEHSHTIPNYLARGFSRGADIDQ